MKLKEKLARDYYDERPEGFGEPTSDFIAGFEKAQELAAEAMSPMLRSMISRSIAAELCRDLGEEEV